MPAAVERRPCVLSGYTETRTTATLTVALYDRGARLRRALGGLATFWGLALASVLIPVAHFLLVPSFLLYGIITFAQRLGAAEVVTAAHGTCPDCGMQQSLDIRGRWRSPRDVTCRACQRSLRLARAEQTSDPSGERGVERCSSAG